MRPLFFDNKKVTAADTAPTMVRKISKLLNSLPRDHVISTQELERRLKYRKGVVEGNHKRFKQTLQPFRFRARYNLVVWANPKTIADLKRGKFNHIFQTTAV